MELVSSSLLLLEVVVVVVVLVSSTLVVWSLSRLWKIEKPCDEPDPSDHFSVETWQENHSTWNSSRYTFFAFVVKVMMEFLP